MTEPFSQNRFVYCLSINMAEPPTGEQETTERILARQDRFNVILAEHLKPHIKQLRLADAFLKFTGDGFLLMTDEAANVPALCCLSSILAKRFGEDVSQTSGISHERLPLLRLALFSGRDRRIEMPDGRREWVGDSLRKASQLVGLALAGQVIIDSSVKALAAGGFDMRAHDAGMISVGQAPTEERSSLWLLGEPDMTSIADSAAPDLFIYTLNALGRTREAGEIALAAAARFAREAGEKSGEQVFGAEDTQGWGRLLSNLTDYSSAQALFMKAQEDGLQPDTATYNTLLTLAPDFNTASSLFDAMRRDGIQPDTSTYNALISTAPDFDTARGMFETLHATGIAPDSHTYDALIAKTDYTGAKTLFDAMRRDGIQPDTSTYNALISKSRDYETAIYWFDNLMEEGLQPGINAYNALIAKAQDFATAKSWLDAMESNGIQPNLSSFNRLIPKAPSNDSLQALLKLLDFEGIRLNAVTYNMLISKAVDFDGAVAWLEIMKKDGIQPTLDTYNRLFGKNISAKTADDLMSWYLSQEYHPEEPVQTAMATYRKHGLIDRALRIAVEYPHLSGSKKLIREIMDEVFAYLNTIRDEAVPPSVSSYNAIISKAPYFDAAKSWLEAMRKKGVQPDLVTYNTLISKAAGFERAKSLIEMMRNDGIRPNIDTFNRLFSKDLSTVTADELIVWYRAQEYHPDEAVETAIASFKRCGRIDQSLRLALECAHLKESKKVIRQYMAEVLSYLETIREEGVKPNVVTYSALIAKAPYYDIAAAWLETMRGKGVKPNVVTYNTLIFKAPDFETAEALLDEMRSESIEPNVITYSTLISKAEEYETAAALFEEMEREAVCPNVITYNALILKSPDFERANSWLGLMKRENVEPDVMTYNTLIFKAPDFEVAEGLFDMMGAAGIQPNIVTYNRLFSKDLSAKRAEDILTWYTAQAYHPDEPVQAAISAFRRIGQIEDALRLALDYPHLQVARRLMREHTGEAVEYFKDILAREPANAKAEYALALTLIESGQTKEQAPHLSNTADRAESVRAGNTVEGLSRAHTNA